MSRTLRSAAAAGAAALAFVALTGASSQAATESASPSASGRWIYLSSIKCNTQEDWRQDEVTLEINGKRVWTEFMDSGDKVTIHDYVSIGSKATIKLVEKDGPDPDDVLGKHTVRKKGSGVLSFTKGADYKLSYKIGSA